MVNQKLDAIDLGLMTRESKGSIVIVEDDPAMNLALRRFLTAVGFKTIAFDSAEDLLEHPAPAASAVCLILDIHLTGISGFELQKRLHQWGAIPPTIFITADENTSFDNGQLPAAACLRKPFSGKRLLAAIREALDRVNEEAKRL